MSSPPLTFLDILLLYRLRAGVVRRLSVAIAALVCAYLAVFHDWPWWAWSLVGIGFVVFTPVLWGGLLTLLELRQR
jgi:hypothetical protein